MPHLHSFSYFSRSVRTWNLSPEHAVWSPTCIHLVISPGVSGHWTCRPNSAVWSPICIHLVISPLVPGHGTSCLNTQSDLHLLTFSTLYINMHMVPHRDQSRAPRLCSRCLHDSGWAHILKTCCCDHECTASGYMWYRDYIVLSLSEFTFIHLDFYPAPEWLLPRHDVDFPSRISVLLM